MVGLLVTGAVAGPHGLGLVGATHDVEYLTELGVVLLLFTIGIECSLNELVRLRKSVLLGGSLQVLLTFAVTAMVASHLGATVGESVFMGLLVAQENSHASRAHR
jgi:CPA2 family monovalent cation:H+ antiporter-2